MKGHFDHSSTASIVSSRTNPRRTQCHHFFGTRFTQGNEIFACMLMAGFREQITESKPETERQPGHIEYRAARDALTDACFVFHGWV